jgi:hypothetical protein
MGYRDYSIQQPGCWQQPGLNVKKGCWIVLAGCWSSPDGRSTAVGVTQHHTKKKSATFSTVTTIRVETITVCTIYQTWDIYWHWMSLREYSNLPTRKCHGPLWLQPSSWPLWLWRWPLWPWAASEEDMYIYMVPKVLSSGIGSYVIVIPMFLNTEPRNCLFLSILSFEDALNLRDNFPNSLPKKSVLTWTFDTGVQARPRGGGAKAPKRTTSDVLGATRGSEKGATKRQSTRCGICREFGHNRTVLFVRLVLLYKAIGILPYIESYY